jgi:hypothetical protein
MRVFVHAFHKTGSMFLYRYFGSFARHASASFFSVNSESRNELDWKTCEGDFVVCPIRATGAMVPSSATRVFHLRNPVDVLISQYYSFGWTHPALPTAGFSARRAAIRRQTVDEYCVEACTELADKYRVMMADYARCTGAIPSDYSLMRDNFCVWNAAMCRMLPDGVRASAEGKLLKAFRGEFGLLRRMSRCPPARILSERVTPHRRDGSDNQKHRYLRRDTVVRLEAELADVLDAFETFRAASRAALRTAR